MNPERKIDPAAATPKVFMMLVGVTLVGLGVSQWRNPASPDDSIWRTSGGSRFMSAEARRAMAAVTVVAGLLMTIGMAVALFTDSN